MYYNIIQRTSGCFQSLIPPRTCRGGTRALPSSPHHIGTVVGDDRCSPFNAVISNYSSHPDSSFAFLSCS